MPRDESRGNPRRCPDCLEQVPYKVRICPNCKAYQDWRRYFGFGQTTLALLVALISVATPFVQTVPNLFRSRGSDISILMESATDRELSLIARNDGRSSGVMRAIELSVRPPRKVHYLNPPVIPIVDRGTFLESNYQTRLTLNLGQRSEEELCKVALEEADLDSLRAAAPRYLPGYALLDWELQPMLERFECHLHYADTGFYDEPAYKRGAVSCALLPWLYNCVSRAFGNLDTKSSGNE